MILDYRLDGEVAVLTVDDGKANVYSHAVLAAIDEGLDRAEGEASTVLLAGRPGRFSAGFDLGVLRAGSEPMRALVTAGVELALRIFTFPMPVVAACTGHALGMGAIVLLTCDVRVGADGPFQLGLNEVAVGFGLPQFAIELARYRMPPSGFDSVLLGRTYEPAGAVAVGYLDRVVTAEDVVAAAAVEAQQLSELSTGAVARSKRRARQVLADDIAGGLAADLAAVARPEEPSR